MVAAIEPRRSFNIVSLYDEETANRRNSVLLVFLVMLSFALFGYVIGYALTATPEAPSSP